MAIKEQILGLLSLRRAESALPSLVGNAKFLADGVICCSNRNDGDSRYPYSNDGLTLWSYASGCLTLNESSLFYFPPTLEGKEPYIAFFAGVDKGNAYVPYSLTGTALPQYGQKKPATFFTPAASYYINEDDGIRTALRSFIGRNKEVFFTLYVENISQKKEEVFLSPFFDCLLMHGSGESEETKWFKKCELTTEGALFGSVEDISREVHLSNSYHIKRILDKEREVTSTTSRGVYAGGKNTSVSMSSSLRNGAFPITKEKTLFSDTAAFGDIVKATLLPGESLEITYVLSEKVSEIASLSKVEEELENVKKENEQIFSSPDMLRIRFNDLEDKTVDENSLNSFIAQVMRQCEYGALAKNSSLSLLGVRDVAQMLEASLMFDPKAAKKKIKEVLSFEQSNGRFPRQYSLPKDKEDSKIDSRAFIDQGQWVISLLRTYLSFSGDTSFLQEDVGFIRMQNETAKRLEETSSIYDHLKKALSYLTSNLDETTGCLHALYGDWNDAVDGLGISKEKEKSFGNGVSAMATFHLYKNLLEMSEIALLMNDNSYSNECIIAAKKLSKDAKAHLIVRNEQEKRIIHGWGDNQSFYVGSFKDIDGLSRVGLASNAFYVISEIDENIEVTKDTIINAYQQLDSKYGLKTFTPGFLKDSSKVGRIVNLPIGTAENAAVYVHASMFGIKSLFMLNEPKEAFIQLKKVLPLTHDFISTSPFVMPNSYIENPDIGVDGESMNDWYTGSSNTLIKMLVGEVFGIHPSLNNTVTIQPASYMWSKKADISIKIKGKTFIVRYRNGKKGKRSFLVNNEEVNPTLNGLGIESISIDSSKADNFVISIID